MMTKVITLTEFTRNVSQKLELCKEGREIVITFHGKPYVKVISLEDKVVSLDKEGQAEVITLSETGDKVITLDRKNADEIRDGLRAKTAEIIAKPLVSEVGPANYCEACKRLRMPLKEAVGEFEIDEGDGIKKRWLCDRHNKIALVGVGQ